MKTLLTTLNSKFIHSSLALRYLKSYCKDSLPEIYIEEYTINNDMDYILGELYKKQLDLVCFSCYIWNINETLQLAKELKKIKKDIKILLGGPEVSYDPLKIIENNKYIDYIIYGEGEETLDELLKLLNNMGSIEKIKGLVYRKGNHVYINEERPLICNLDTIPFPYDNFNELENRIIYYESSRGCPFNCQYCLSSTIKGVRFFSIDRVKKDLKKFVDAKVKQVKFVDRTFNANKNHCLQIMKYLKDIDNGQINFHFEITASLIDDEILDFLATVRNGLFQFEIGVQSTNPATLKEIKRHVDFERVSYVCKRILRQNNIHMHLDLIAGLPFEDYETFLNSFDDVYNLNPDKLQLGFLKLIKGSGIRINSKAYGYTHRDTPPYEVLENEYINFAEMLTLKNIEEMVETYYNSHSFDFSLKYIINNYYKKPWKFYEELASFWEEKGYHHKAHKKEDVFKILMDFYVELNTSDLDMFQEILKYDYVRSFRSTLPEFFNKFTLEDFKDRCHKFLQDQDNINRFLVEFIGQPAKKIMKKVHFEVFKYDIFKLIEGNSSDNTEEITVLFNYNVKDEEGVRSKSYKIDL